MVVLYVPKYIRAPLLKTYIYRKNSNCNDEAYFFSISNEYSSEIKYVKLKLRLLYWCYYHEYALLLTDIINMPCSVTTATLFHNQKTYTGIF